MSVPFRLRSPAEAMWTPSPKNPVMEQFSTLSVPTELTVIPLPLPPFSVSARSVTLSEGPALTVMAEPEAGWMKAVTPAGASIVTPFVIVTGP